MLTIASSASTVPTGTFTPAADFLAVLQSGTAVRGLPPPPPPPPPLPPPPSRRQQGYYVSPAAPGKLTPTYTPALLPYGYPAGRLKCYNPMHSLVRKFSFPHTRCRQEQFRLSTWFTGTYFGYASVPSTTLPSHTGPAKVLAYLPSAYAVPTYISTYATTPTAPPPTVLPAYGGSNGYGGYGNYGGPGASSRLIG